MKKLKYIIVMLCIGSWMASCNYLNVDKYFDDSLQYDSIFANKKNLMKYMWNIATMFPDEGQIISYPYTPGPMATDEAFCLNSTNEMRGLAFVTGEVSSNDQRGLGDNWKSMYKIIRRCNLLLSRMNETADLSTFDEMDILGYTHFMRAYAYNHILMNYGPVILLGDKVLESNEQPEYYNACRATYDESVDYICDEFEEAAKYLPTSVSIGFFGRPTQGSAYGMIARLRLQQASPLYNGGDAARKYFGSWTRKIDGVHYISQTYDERKWAIAAAAAKRIIDSGLYELYTAEKDEDTPELPNTDDPDLKTKNFPNGAANIDPFHSYSDIFTGEAVANQVKEFVWGRNSGSIRNLSMYSFNTNVLGGWNSLSIPQKIIDTFYMCDGKDINNSSAEYPYSEEGSTSGQKKFSGYILNNNVSNMYVNREMRFYASVGYCERLWPCNSTSETARRNFRATYYFGGDGNSGKYSNPNNPEDYPATGYVCVKYIHPDDAWKGDGAKALAKAFGIIRYAEILLSYVEAMNNLSQDYTIQLGDDTYQISRNNTDMKFYFNQIRYRAGLPGITLADTQDPTKIQKLLERERMIEFLHENRRYFDVRRWGIYQESESEPIMGMNMEGSKKEFYERTIVNSQRVRNRIVDKKLIFVPISKNEIRKVKDLDQNPGWED